MENNMKSIVKIENFPSRVEKFDLLDKYLSDKNMIKDYNSIKKRMIVYFKNNFFTINKIL